MQRNELVRGICEKMLERKEKTRDRCMIAGIEGQSCSGKSVLSQEIKDSLMQMGCMADVVSIDDFCNKRETRYSGYETAYEQHYYRNFDYDKFERDILAQARNTGKLEFSEYVLDAVKDTYSKKLDVSVGSNGILIVEGIFIFKNEFKKYFDYSIMLVIDENEQLRRASQRDFFKNDSLEALFKKYEERYAPGYELHEKLNQPYEFADLIIDNTDVEHPCVVRNSIR